MTYKECKEYFVAFQENLKASIYFFSFPKSWIRCFSRSGVPSRVLARLRLV